ncbi:MAG TPA: hypothetical protein VKQ36_00220, partial [Ktedonobacterales bacterium]|nr:hypothetical protein [Ktedonobacterales bacterium]
PWVAYFAAIAYLDSYMVAFMTLAILMTWHAVRHPRWLPLVSALLGIAFVSKYTAAFAGLPIVLYLAYYYFFVERKRPPWQLWLAPLALVLAIYIADPEIWINPISRLWNSMLFEFDHALRGHGVYWNGRVWEHVPPGEALYILLAKMSLFIVVPALAVLPWGVWRVIRVMRAQRTGYTPTAIDDRAAFSLFWFGGLLSTLGLLTIVVGTHYILPLAPAVAFIGAWALCHGGEWLMTYLGKLNGNANVLGDAHTLAEMPHAAAYTAQRSEPSRWERLGAWLSNALNIILGELNDTPDLMIERPTPSAWNTPHRHMAWRALATQGLTLVVLVGVGLALTLPPAHGLSTVSQAEGYTSEWLSSENQSLQVAYPAYSDAVDWIVQHTQGRTSVALMSTSGTLDYWMQHHQGTFPQRIRLETGAVCETDAPSPPHCGTPTNAQYVVWPMHLVQRQQLFPMPTNWRSHVVTTITGGKTIYCYILHMHN